MIKIFTKTCLSKVKAKTPHTRVGRFLIRCKFYINHMNKLERIFVLKRILTIFLITILLFSLCACTQSNDDINEHHNVVIEHNNTIPTGAKYETVDGTVLNEGSPFPTETQVGDIYTYKDYMYKYGMSFKIAQDGTETWYKSGLNGWGVLAVSTEKSQYDNPLENICNKPIVSMSYTYSFCRKLRSADFLKIPKTVVNMDGTFYGCERLEVLPIIPDSVGYMSYTFAQCQSLTDASELKFPGRVSELNHTFEGCASLKKAPKIPNSITSMSNTFAMCLSLTFAPDIPSMVNKIDSVFYGCAQLSGGVVINSTPNIFDKALFNTRIVAIFGECDETLKEDILKTR